MTRCFTDFRINCAQNRKSRGGGGGEGPGGIPVFGLPEYKIVILGVVSAQFNIDIVSFPDRIFRARLSRSVKSSLGTRLI